MTDYGHDLRFGVNGLPAAGQPEAVVDETAPRVRALVAEARGAA
jgi:hypothetical protein